VNSCISIGLCLGTIILMVLLFESIPRFLYLYRDKINYNSIFFKCGEKICDVNFKPLERNDDNVFKIFIIGDSISAEAYGKIKLYPSHIQDLLDRNIYDMRYIVYNFALGGSNTYNQYKITRKIIKFNPDLIILQFYSNDIDNRIIKVYNNDSGFEMEREEIYLLSNTKLIKNLVDHSHFFRFFTQRAYNLLEKMNYPTANFIYNYGHVESKKYLRKIKKLVDKSEIPFLVVLFPDTNYDFNDYPKGEVSCSGACTDIFFYSWFYNTTSNLDIQILDLYAYFKDYPYLDVRADQAGHLNDNGNIIAAKSIYSYLINSNIIEK